MMSKLVFWFSNQFFFRRIDIICIKAYNLLFIVFSSHFNVNIWEQISNHLFQIILVFREGSVNLLIFQTGPVCYSGHRDSSLVKGLTSRRHFFSATLHMTPKTQLTLLCSYPVPTFHLDIWNLLLWILRAFLEPRTLSQWSHGIDSPSKWLASIWLAVSSFPHNLQMKGVARPGGKLRTSIQNHNLLFLLLTLYILIQCLHVATVFWGEFLKLLWPLLSTVEIWSF